MADTFRKDRAATSALERIACSIVASSHATAGSFREYSRSLSVGRSVAVKERLLISMLIAQCLLVARFSRGGHEKRPSPSTDFDHTSDLLLFPYGVRLVGRHAYEYSTPSAAFSHREAFLTCIFYLGVTQFG